MKQYSFNVNGKSAVGNLTWNSNGTLQQLAITDPFNSQDNQTCNNTFDALARISSVSCNNGTAWGQTFAYDAFGNVSKSVPSGATGISWLPGYNTSTNQYTLGGTTYDINGNLKNDTFNTYTWDSYGNLASVNGQTATYDGFGRMVENHNGSNQFVYSSAGQQPLAWMQGQVPLYVYVPLPAGAFAMYNSSGLVQYNHADWLGSARLFSTPSRTAIPALAYAPFGEGYAGGAGWWIQFTGAGNAWTVADSENQSGSLEDFLFRRYSPVQGRWISPDPAGLSAADPTNPQSWNRYAYALNNPLSNIDPAGLDCIYDNGDGTATVYTGDCLSSTDNGFYVNGTVGQDSQLILDQSTGDLQVGYTAANGSYGTTDIRGFADPLTSNSGQLPAFAKGVFSQPVFNNAAGFVNALGTLEASIMAPWAVSAAQCTTGGSNAACAANMAMAVLPEVGALGEGATLLRAGRGLHAAELLEKAGGLARATEDFESLQGAEKTIGDVKVKELADGTKAVLRDSSRDGRPTLEIQHPSGEVTKYRYN